LGHHMFRIAPHCCILLPTMSHTHIHTHIHTHMQAHTATHTDTDTETHTQTSTRTHADSISQQQSHFNLFGDDFVANLHTTEIS
jgi:hypothetical protein